MSNYDEILYNANYDVIIIITLNYFAYLFNFIGILLVISVVLVGASVKHALSIS